jgi:outer membrane protein TolC
VKPVLLSAFIAALLAQPGALGVRRAWAATDAVSSAPVVPFDDAVAAILARSTAIATQQASLGSVHALNLPIRLAFAPSLSFDAKQVSTGGEGIDGYTNARQLEGVAQLNLFRWGADYHNWQAASHDESAQQELLEDAYLRTQDGAVVALVTYIQRSKEADVAQSIVKMREDSLAIARQRYDGGYLPQQEMEKVSVDLDNANALLADARIAAIDAAAALENLLGHTRVALEWPWRDRFSTLKAAAVANPLDDSALAQLLSHRPDWRAAQSKVDAEDARLSRSWSLLGPSLDGQFAYGYYYSDATGSAGQPGPFGGPQWQGTLSVSLPFFDRLSLYSNARSQSFVKGAAEASLEQVHRDARSDWSIARQTFVTALGSAQVRDKTLSVSRRLYQDNLARFRNGRISADDLVLEQTRLFDSERLAVRGWASVHLAYSQLCKAQGLKLSECKVQ